MRENATSTKEIVDKLSVSLSTIKQVAPHITTSEMSLLRNATVGQVQKEYGIETENKAVTMYEEVTGYEVGCRNEETYRWKIYKLVGGSTEEAGVVADDDDKGDREVDFMIVGKVDGISMHLDVRDEDATKW